MVKHILYAIVLNFNLLFLIGKKDSNPMDNVKFYTKYDLEKSFSMQKEEVSSFVPQCFREITIRIYVKGNFDLE
jgi:hypothetical protein